MRSLTPVTPACPAPLRVLCLPLSTQPRFTNALPGDGCAGQAFGAVDLKGGKWVDFDGNLPHCTLPFTGTRYTLIVSAATLGRLGL